MLTEAELQKIERGEAQYNYVPVLIAEIRRLRELTTVPRGPLEGRQSRRLFASLIDGD